MQEKDTVIRDTCNFREVQPIMMALPYPAIQVKEKNPEYARILSFDYCGSVSELSAITQYINNQNRLSCERCPFAQTILGIAIAEMIHLQKLGQLIFLLGGEVAFCTGMQGGKQQFWTPAYLHTPNNLKEMILADIESEKAAILQYRKHMRMIKDAYINAVLERIIQDEEYHLMILRAL